MDFFLLFGHLCDTIQLVRDQELLLAVFEQLVHIVGGRGRERDHMNIRTYAALAAATISAFAYSADMMYYLGYGKTSFASLNGKAVGDELKSVSAIGNIGNTVTVSIFGKSTSSSTLQYGGGCMFVGFDTATTNGWRGTLEVFGQRSWAKALILCGYYT